MTDHQWPHDASADDRWIYAEMDVHHATAASPESAEWLAYAVDRLLVPPSRAAADARADLRIRYAAFGERHDGRRVRQSGDGVEDWRRLLDGIGAGSIATATLAISVLDTDQVPRIVATASLGPAGLGKLVRNRQLTCGLLRGIYSGELPNDVLRDWRDFLVTRAPALSPHQGWLTVDYDGCAYERRFGGWVGTGLRAAERRLRTYAWGTFLGNGLVEQLGGLSRAMSESPVRATNLTMSGWDLIYCELSGSPDRPDALELAKLRDFLSPVLGAATPGRTYVGPALALAE